MLRRRRSAQAHLVEIVSPRQLEEGELAARGLFAGLAGGEPCSLEIAVAGDGPRHYIRASSAEALGEAVAQLAAAYPQAEVEPIALSERPDLDPLRLGRIEYAEAVELSPRDSALTLNTDLRGRPDALAGVLAAAAEAAGPGSAASCSWRSLRCRPAGRSGCARASSRLAPGARTIGAARSPTCYPYWRSWLWAPPVSSATAGTSRGACSSSPLPAAWPSPPCRSRRSWPRGLPASRGRSPSDWSSRSWAPRCSRRACVSS